MFTTVKTIEHKIRSYIQPLEGNDQSGHIDGLPY